MLLALDGQQLMVMATMLSCPLTVVRCRPFTAAATAVIALVSRVFLFALRVSDVVDVGDAVQDFPRKSEGRYRPRKAARRFFQ